jgi:chemotaxis protein MotB
VSEAGKGGKHPAPERAPAKPARGRAKPWRVTARRGGDDTEAWMQTYLDVLTLMLTLFVMLLAYANFDEQAFSDVKASLQGAVSRQPIQFREPPGGQAAGDKQGAIVGEDSPAVEETRAFLARMREQGLLGDVEVAFEEGRITLQLQDDVLFRSGRARLSSKGHGIIADVVPVLAATQRHISVEGHTDDRPIRSERFASNWELSAGRATEVVRYLIDQGVDRARLRAVGYADTRPLADNTTAAGRARNRRVSIVIQTEPLDGGGGD